MKKMKFDHARGRLFPGATKMLLKMKLTLCIILLSFLGSIASESYSQTARLSLDLKNTSVKEVLGAIENQSEFFFLYSEKIIDVNREVNIDAKESTIEKILDRIFAGTNVYYTVKGRQIVLTTPVVNNFTEASSTQQQKIVSGTVTDENGAPIPGVAIVFKGTTQGTATDIDGKYSLSNIPEGAVLQFSFVGMVSQEIVVGSKTSIDITMQVDAIGIEEVVAIGYGTMSKKDLTGAVSSVQGDQISLRSVESFEKALSGSMAGVSVQSNSGQPGGASSVRVRGIGGINNSEPLYVIDGVVLEAGINNTGVSDNTNPLNGINPKDIESVDVLKDAASAAIYGSRGGNGVIIITTKRGVKGKAVFNYSGSYGVQKTNLKIKAMNGSQFAEMINEMYVNDGKSPKYTAAEVTGFGKGYDYVDAITRLGNMNQQNVSVSGGGEKSNYFFSLNYLDNEGTIINSFYKNIGLRANNDAQVNKWLKLGSSMNITANIYASPDFLETIAGAGPFVQTILYPSIYPVYNEDGSVAGPTDPELERSRNPVANFSSTDYDNIGLKTIANIYAEATLFDGLKFKTSVSSDYGTSSFYSFSPSYDENLTDDISSTLNRSSGYRLAWTWDNSLNYNFSLRGKHKFNLLAGTSSSEAKGRTINASEGYDDNRFKEISGTGLSFTAATGTYVYSIFSIFGRLNYNYDDRYLFAMNVRRDGSSNFGPDNKWGFFPSFSAGWRFTEENFFPENDIVSYGKLRGSWGKVGSDVLPAFTYDPALSSGLGYVLNDDAIQIGVAALQYANPAIQWETSTDWNIAVDLTLFKSAMSFTAEYFNKTRTDMLMKVELPKTSGFSQGAWYNAGEVRNSGLEFSLGYNKIMGDWTINASANLTTFNNEVIDLASEYSLDAIYPANYQNVDNVSIIIKGSEIGSFLGYVHEGIFQNAVEVSAANESARSIAKQNNPSLTDAQLANIYYQKAKTAPGDYKFSDLNGDGIVDLNDREIIGSPIPDFTYGLNFGIVYKDFDMNIQGSGSYGNQIYNLNQIKLIASGRTFNKSTEYLDRWKKEGDSNTIPRAILSDPNENARPSSVYVEDASYFRINNIQLGYTIKSFERMGISNCRIYVSGDNIATFTKYKGSDPAIGTFMGNNGASGIDTDLYPPAKTFSLGVNLKF